MKTIEIANTILTNIPDITSITQIPIIQNIEAFINDVTKWMYGILPAVGLIVILICFIKKSTVDDQEARIWNKRIVGVLITVALGLSVNFIIGLVTGLAGSTTV